MCVRERESERESEREPERNRETTRPHIAPRVRQRRGDGKRLFSVFRRISMELAPGKLMVVVCEAL